MKIEVKNLNKNFKFNHVLNNISVTFESGKIYGLIGRNGSGKSVFLKILCSFYTPSSGEVLQDGYNYILHNTFPKDTRALIESPNFVNELTGFENLKMLAKIQNKIDDQKIIETMEKVNRLDAKDVEFGVYSFGTRQKLGLAQVLMEDPRFIILDEPFNGIEKETVAKLKEVLKEEKLKDKIIIITSHIREDIDELADEVYELENGILKKIGE